MSDGVVINSEYCGPITDPMNVTDEFTRGDIAFYARLMHMAMLRKIENTEDDPFIRTYEGELWYNQFHRVFSDPVFYVDDLRVGENYPCGATCGRHQMRLAIFVQDLAREEAAKARRAVGNGWGIAREHQNDSTSLYRLARWMREVGLEMKRVGVWNPTEGFEDVENPPMVMLSR